MGRPGSGKSTFSIKLQSMLNIPLYHLDKHFFEANWIQRNYQDFLNQQQYFVSQSSWIIDGIQVSFLSYVTASRYLPLF